MNKRLNITLPESTVRLINRVSQRGDRSRLIDRAVIRYIQEEGQTALRKLLREGARKRAERDVQIAEEWFVLDESSRATRR